MKTTTQRFLLSIGLLLLTVSVFAHTAKTSGAQNGQIQPNATMQKGCLLFDGNSAYAQSVQLLGGLQQATMMCWIKLDPNFNSTGMVMGQENFNLSVQVIGGKNILVASTSIQSISGSTSIEPNRWYHIATVYDKISGNIALYLNGDKINNANLLIDTALAMSNSNFTIAKNATTGTGFFNGAIDEVRVFNTALTDSQLQKMVYQEIKSNGNAIAGETIPKNIEGLNWNSLIAYYRMDAAQNQQIENLGLNNATLNCVNANNFETQTAPMPFVTVMDGTLSRAISQDNSVNGDDARQYPWSILQINHNINLASNLTNLAMLIAPNVTVTLTNNNKLENTWYLKLDGKIDLKGRSQLVQTQDSDLDPTSTGQIERDQQGQSNIYNYNYWCPPVSAVNPLANNSGYTVDGILRDGTNPSNPQPIIWSNGLDGSPTTPITLSGFWIFKFQNQSQYYANWTSVGPYGPLMPAQGFTLKGSGCASETQNLTFIGKPNNGNIALPIAGNNMNLTGNPYPSALDANAFIAANKNITNGTLYFWEHFETNSSHQLADYQGGYATRNLVGGVAPVAPVGVSLFGSSSREPRRFIPVGQAFFVQANGVGGNLLFNNNQRGFVKEDAAASNTMFHLSNTDPSAEHFDNQNDEVIEDTYGKIRLGFESGNFHRQVLLGFMDDQASSAMEPGYDAHNIDTQPNDMFLMNINYKLIIEGEGYFDENKIYPIGVKTAALSPVIFTLDGTEHFDPQQPIYLYDNVTHIYHDLRAGNVEIELPAGLLLNRFSLRFKTDSALANSTFTSDESDEIEIAYNTASHMLQLENNNANAAVDTVKLYNVLGQNIAAWTINEDNQDKIELAMQDLSTGTYVVKVHTTQTEISRKIMIK